jgi:hypothetical protein
LGRLDSINHGNDKKLVNYTYDNFGQLAGKLMNSEILRSFNYTILGQVNNIGGEMPGGVGFSEAIEYKKDGNIRSADQLYSSFSGATSSHYDYHYDNLNRLDKVDKGTSEYCTYVYDQLGRLNSKKEDTYNNAVYTYHEKTSRLKSTKSGAVDYIYNDFGDLVVDKIKKMIIEYDWRDMPVRLNFYNSIPDKISCDNHGTFQNIDTDPVMKNYNLYEYMNSKVSENSGVRLLSSVRMVYDASGSRVLKLESGM